MLEELWFTTPKVCAHALGVFLATPSIIREGFSANELIGSGNLWPCPPKFSKNYYVRTAQSLISAIKFVARIFMVQLHLHAQFHGSVQWIGRLLDSRNRK